MGYIYLIGQSDTPDIFKIGCTKNMVDKRSKELQTGNSEELYLSKSFETKQPFKLEKMLHNHYREKHHMNEWYHLFPEDVNSFISVCQQYQANIDALSDNPFF